MNRRSIHSQNSSKSKSRLARLQDKANRMREKVKNSAVAMFERRQSRVSWWQRTFRTPLVGFYGWVRSRCTSLWSAFMTILGLQMVKPMLKGRHGQVAKRPKQVKQAATRGLMHEGLETRQLLAIDMASIVLLTDTGVSNSDNLTSQTAVDFEVEYDSTLGAPGEAIVLRLNDQFGAKVGQIIPPTGQPAGTKITIPANLPTGTSKVVAVPSGSGSLADVTVTVDNDPPEVASMTAGAGYTFEVTFDEPVFNLNSADFALTLSGTTGTVLSVTGAPGTAGPYTVTLDGVTGTGTLRLDVVSNPGTFDEAGNQIVPYTTGPVVNVDSTAPVVLSSVPNVAGPTNGPVSFTVSFDEAVTNVTSADFTLVGSGALGTIDAISGGGTSWTVDIVGLAGDGTLRLDVNAGATAEDLSGNKIAVAFTTGLTVDVDVVAPNVVSSVPMGASPTNAPSIVFEVMFDESVVNVTPVDFTAFTVTGNATGVVTAVSGTGFGPYLVTVSSVMGNGTLRLDLKAGTNVIDDAGNIANAFTGGSTVTIDTTADAAPFATLTILDVNGFVDSTENLALVPFSISGLDSDATAIVTFTQGATNALVFVDMNNTTYDVDFSAFGQGLVTATVAITDILGNTATGIGDTTVIDTVGPTVAVTAAAPTTTSLPIEFNVAFDTPIAASTFAPADITVTSTAGMWAGTPVVTVTQVGATNNWTVSVSGTLLQSTGTVTATFTGSVTDLAGNPNQTPSPASASTTLAARSITVTANDSNIVEDAPTNAQFTLNMDNSSAAPVVVTFLASGTADATTATPAPFAADYVFGPQVTSLGGNLYSVTVPANTTSFVFDADILDDTLYDPNETIVITLVSATNTPAMDAIVVLNGPAALRTTTIVDNEAPAGVTVSVAATTPTAQEGNPTATINGKFTVNLTQAFDSPFTLNLAIGGTAALGSDYTFSTGSVVGNTLEVTVPAGATSVVVDVLPVAENATVELTETVTLTPIATSFPALPVTLGGGSTVTILDDDTATVSISQTSGTEGGPNGSFTVSQSKASSTNTVVNLTVTNGPDAVFGVDYWLTYPVVDNDLTLTSSSNTGSFVKNDSLATAQNVDAENWNLANVPSFAVNRPSVTIQGTGTAGDTYDYYSFTVGADQVVQAAVTSSAYRVALYRADGTLVSTSTTSLTTPALTAGTYTLGVARSGAATPANGFTGGTLQPGDAYTVHLAVGGHATPVPTSITIPAGQLAATMTMAIVADNLLENDELVTVSLTSMGVADPDISLAPVGLTNPRVATSTISDNDTATVKLIGTGTNFNLNIAGVAVNPIEPGANGRFTVEISKPSDTAIVVPFEIAGISEAVYGADYTFGAGVSGSGTKLDPFRITIPAFSTSAPILINVINDDVVEDDESIVLNLVDIPAVAITDPNRALVGPNGDAQVTLAAQSSDSVQVKDEDLAVVTVNSNIDTAVEGGTNGQFTIQLSKASAPNTAILPLIPVTSNVNTVVTYTLTGSAANAGDITNALSGTLSIPAGSSSVTLNINAIADALNEPVENVVMTITSVTQGDADVSLDATRLSDTVFVVDANNTSVKVFTSDPAASEIGPDNGAFTFELQGDNLDPAVAVEVTYTLSGTAAFGADYTTPGFTGKITIPAGGKSAVLPINVLQDNIVEGPESVQVKIVSVAAISGVSGPIGVNATDTASLVIVDGNTSAVTVTASDAVIGEGTDDGEFTISLSNPIATGLFVNYSITAPDPDGVAGGWNAVNLDGSDFTIEDELGNPLTLPSGSIFIPPNLTSFKIKVKVTDDAILETWLERIQLSLTSTGNAAVSVGAPGSDFMDILPDQTVSVVANANATEGGAVGSFKIELARASTTDTFVSYSLTGTAIEGSDYASPGGVAKITAGQTWVLVPINASAVGNDLIPEVTESVNITLNSVSNVAPDAGADIRLSATKTATINILDDDLAFVTIASTDRSEGDAAGSVMFNLTLRDVNGNPVTATEDVMVNYTTGGSAVAADFTLTPVGTATISKGASSTTITVNVVDDNLLEGTETVTATMTGTGGLLASKIALSSIVGPTLNFLGTHDTYIDPLQPFANLDTTGISVQAGLNPRQGLLRFDNLFGPGVGQIPAGAQVAAANLNLTASGAGSVNLHNMLVPWTEALTWHATLSLGNGSPGIDADGFDAALIPTASGVVNTANVTSSVVAWQANPAVNFGWALLPNAGAISYSDSESANPPALSVTLSTSATASIFDNDGGQIQITNIQHAKEESTDGVVTVSLPNALGAGQTVSVNYTVGGAGTATAGADYVAGTANLNFAAGSKTATFLVPVLGDNLIEGTETVQVKLNSFVASSPSVQALLTIDTTPQFVNIEDDDTTTASVSVLTSGTEAPAGATHTDPVFRVSLGKTSTQPTVINFALSGTTTPGQDYVVPASTQVTIPAGSLFTDVTIDLIDDPINEATETMIFTLTSVASGPGVTIGAGGAVTDLIEDDDLLTATIAASDPTASENPTSNTGTFTFGIQASDKVTTVPFTITGTAAPLTLPLVIPVGGVTNISGPDYSLQAGANMVFTSLFGGTITFPTSTTPQTTTITLTAVQDYLAEAMENVTITLGTPSNANGVPSVSGSPATVNIIDEDFSVKIEKTASFAQEDGAGNGGLNGQFTVTIANPTLPGDDVTVPFTIPNTGAFGTATYGVDYTLTGIGVFVDSVTTGGGGQVVGRAVIAGGTTTRLITVTVLPDNLVEGPENIVITIGTPVDTNLNPDAKISGQLSKLGSPITATETIIDDDAPTLKVTVLDDIDGIGPDPAGIGEADANKGAYRFELNQVIPGVATTITYQIVAASTTASPSDYSLSGTFGTVTIPAGSSFADVILTPVDDNLVEGDETLTLKIVTATALPFPVTISATQDQATATIVDNDVATVSITAIDADAREPSNPGIFEVKMSKPSQTATVVTYSVGGSARDGAAPGLLAPHDPYDYKTLTGTVTIPAGATTATILVDVFDDDIVEDNETVVATLNAATNNPLVTASGNATVIIGADPAAGQDVTVATVSKVSDATEGGLAGIFLVTLSKAADEDITFPVNVSHGTTSAADISIPTSVTVLKGTLGTTFSVVADDDSIVEGNETFSVTLGTPTAAFVNPVTTALVSVAGNPSMTVIDNDTNVLKITAVDVVEGDSGTKEMIFTVESPNAVKAGFTVPYFLSGGTANTGAGAGANDFVAATANGSLSFTGAAGQKQTFAVLVNGDLVVENDETIEITLGTVTSGTPSVLPQITSGAKGTGTIINNDTAVFVVGDASLVEGNTGGLGGVTNMGFTISIAGGYTIDEAVSVTVSLVDGTATGLPLPASGPIPEGTDYDSSAQVVNFAAYSTSQPFNVKIVGDTRVEGMQTLPLHPVNGFETFTVKMATAATKSTNVSDTATGSILDDDVAVLTVSSNPAVGGDNFASEPGAGFGSGKFVFAVTNPVQADVVISYSYTVDGAAGDPNGDLVAPLSGTITIPGGIGNINKSVVLDINVFDDNLVEDNEDVVITITSITTDPSVTFSATPATVTILDDDVATISIKATDKLAQEPGPGLNEGTATYEVFLSKLSDTPTTVNLGIVAAGTTASPSDYKGLPTTVTIPANQLSTTFTIEAIQDGLIEATETLQVELLNPVSGHPNIIITSNKALQSDTISILDAGTGVFVSIDTSKTTDAFEEGTKNGQFVVQITDNLGNPITLAQNVTVTYSVAGSTAVSPDDYAGLTNIVVISAGQSTAPVAVQPIDDSLVEGTEFVNLTINGATIGAVQVALGTAATPALPINEQVNIIDNDIVPATVEAITINGGVAQRSNLKTMSVQFDSMVVLQAGALTVQKRSDVSPLAPPVGNVGGVNVTTALVAGKTVATLTFTPNSAFVDAAGSLVDGNYQVTIDASKVLTGGFTPMVASPTDATGGDLVFGDEAVDGFYRMFGDEDGMIIATGEAFVDGSDFVSARNDFLNFVATDYFDREGDGFVDGLDFVEIRNRFLAFMERNLNGF